MTNKKEGEQQKFPKKVFGELKLNGGLNHLTQIIKTKYLYPTKDYPEGKAVIEIIAPDHINSFSIKKDDIKDIPERIMQLSMMMDRLQDSRDKELIADNINFNKKLMELAENEKHSFQAKSFRFIEKDYVRTQQLMSDLAKLFGYLFYKYKNDIEKESRVEYMASSRNAIAIGMATKVRENFIQGFMEGINEQKK